VSGRACTLGIVKRLREYLGDETGNHVGYRPTLKPPPVCGQWYISIGQDTYTINGFSNVNGIDARHTVSICVTVKYGFAPQDRQNDLMSHNWDLRNQGLQIASEGRPTLVELDTIQPSITDLSELIHDLMIQDYETVKCMNFFLGDDQEGETHTPEVGGDTFWGFCEPFHTGSMGVVQEASAEWVGGQPGAACPGDILTRVLTVSGARSIVPSRYVRGLDRDLFSQ